MKLEIGKKYKSRSGKIYTVTTSNGYTYGHENCAGIWYEGGNCLASKSHNANDLIEEVRECNMEFLTHTGVSNIGEVGPLKVGDRVTFSDGSYSCYPTKGGFKNDHPATPGREETGTIIATGCSLPALYSYGNFDKKQHNDTIVWVDSGKAYFTRLAFLRKV
jgi:hypothetical protein